ncbi:alcohol oxidase [Aspergillus sclerotioniger CBS 115572]|uniref:Alcohol oxidase n=1 Tax=Aspergillus sclerotioniger CBS 115572 TaxID=1450535 RepID=A0A317XEA7_9EURO|nr:alcohol oxidase [Aspergillus sclerotioniger CBS 115572]PWY95967.1 alcohol oxidase [Aspergillus sclerotioniger CBS 115572]
MLPTSIPSLFLLLSTTTVSAYPHAFPHLQHFLSNELPPDDPPPPTNPYDYIVVGGGTTGLLVASRLAKAGNSVAVIEKGEYPTGNLTTIPGYNEQWFSKDPSPDWDNILWKWPTEPQVGGNPQQHMMGKMIGGSQGLTFVDYFRTTKGALGKWADQVGDESWSWENVQKYYKQSFKFTGPNNTARGLNATPDYDQSQIIGPTPGPLELTFPKYAQAFSSWVKLGLRELGVAVNRVFVEGDIKGVSWIANMIDSQTGNRATTYTAFLDPTLNDGTSKIDVFVGTMAEKIVFLELRSGRPVARGVSVKRRDEGSFTIAASKEVILAGGPILTPQLLMVSGVGPQDHLREQGVEVVLDKPGVGQDYNDHILLGVTRAVQVETTSILLNDSRRWEECDKFQANADGMLADPGADLVGFVDFPSDIRSSLSGTTLSDLSEFPSDWPDMCVVSSPLGVNEEPEHNYAELVCIPMTPTSKGTITLRSNSMDDNPVLDPKWLSTQTDLEVAVAGLQYLLRLYDTSAMSHILDCPATSANLETASWNELADMVKSSYRSLNHQSASCRMGKKDDPMAVVDSTAKVIGISGLRIADPSAFPFLPAGFPLGTAYMFAEKIADNILAENGGDEDEQRGEL